MKYVQSITSITTAPNHQVNYHARESSMKIVDVKTAFKHPAPPPPLQTGYLSHILSNNRAQMML